MSQCTVSTDNWLEVYSKWLCGVIVTAEISTVKYLDMRIYLQNWNQIHSLCPYTLYYVYSLESGINRALHNLARLVPVAICHKIHFFTSPTMKFSKIFSKMLVRPCNSGSLQVLVFQSSCVLIAAVIDIINEISTRNVQIVF